MDIFHLAIEDKLLIFDRSRCRLTVSPWRPDADGVELFMQYPCVLNEDGTNGSLWKVLNERITFEDGMDLEMEDDGELHIELSSVEGNDVCLAFTLPEEWTVMPDTTEPEQRPDGEDGA